MDFADFTSRRHVGPPRPELSHILIQVLQAASKKAEMLGPWVRPMRGDKAAHYRGTPLLDLQESPTLHHRHDERPASKSAWRMLTLWMATLAITLLTACGGGSSSSGSSTAPSTAPGAPTGVVVTAGNGQATITWQSVPGATSYNIYRSTTLGLLGTKVGASATTSFVDTTAANNTTYYYQVTVDNAAGEGPTSTQSPGTTP
ncbi:MAG: fibronectin type III domain-containing protein, partial [Burkholderiales bacterium]